MSHSLIERLKFLVRVVDREVHHLNTTTNKLFVIEFSKERAKALEIDDDLSERLEAFTSRFSRLQDTLGDKLIPLLLEWVGEHQKTYIDNLDVAERIGWIPSVDDWQAMRFLRNQMVHEYIEDLDVLVSAINSAHNFVPMLNLVVQNLKSEMQGRELI